MTKKTETRSQAISFRSDDSKFELHGLVASYGVQTDVGGQFIEQIAPGAFTRALREKQDVRILLNHNPDVVLARTGSGTADLFDSKEGLRCVIRLDPTNTKHAEVYSAVKRGDINQMSFAFKPAPNGDRWEQRNGKPFRVLMDLDLFDASVVTYPQYKTGTSVSARHAVADDAALDEYHRRRAKEIEAEILRNAPGFIITEDLRVLPMSQAEVDARTDARNRIRAAEIEQQILRDQTLAEIEAAKKGLN
jgi:HK97 family phage prohead protease